MPGLTIVGARLLDARSATPIEGDVLVVGDDGRIRSVGGDRTANDVGMTVVDVAGATVVPGLVDCHVHIGARHEPVQDVIRVSYTEYIGRMLTGGRNFLHAGVTTARDAGGATAGLKRLFASGAFPGPRLQVSAMPLSITGGHGDGATPSGVDLYGDLPASELPSGLADGVDAVRRVTRLQIRAGADWIKAMATGGVYSLMDAPDAVQFTEAEMAVMVEEAANAGLRGVMAHAENARGILNALRAGVRSIEHGDGLDEAVVDLMLERDVALVPTFLVVEEMLREDRVADGTTPPWAVEKVTELLPGIERGFQLAVSRGVRVAMGTDGGEQSHLPTELSLMVEHGLPPLDALRAATLEAARLLGLEDEIGTLEVGKQADVIVVDGDPLAEPSLWRDPGRVTMVVQGGRVVVDRRPSVTHTTDRGDQT